MAEKWSVIQSSNEFQALSPSQQQATKQRYFDNVIATDESFTSLDGEQKAVVAQRFNSIPTPQQTEAVATKSFSDDIDLVRKTMPKIVPLGGIPSAAGGRQAALVNQQRQMEARDARQQFFTSGGTPDQLQVMQDTLNQVDAPPTFGRTVGATAGAVAIPAILGQIPPFTLIPEEYVTIPFAIRLASAGLGGAVGEATQIGLEEKRVATKGELLKAFGTELAFEAGGTGVAKAAGLAFSPFVKQTVPDAARIADDFAKFGGTLPPSSLDKRFTLSLIDEIGRSGFASKQIAEDIAEKNIDVYNAYSDSLLDMMARGFGQRGKLDLGKEFAEGITKPDGKVFNTMDDIFTPLYQKIDDLTTGGEVGVITKGTKQFSILDDTGNPIKGDVLKIVKERPLQGTVSINKLVNFASKELSEDARLAENILSEAGRSRLRKIVKLGKMSEGRLNLTDLRRLRSSLLKERAKLARDGDISDSIVKRLSTLTNDALFKPDKASGFTGEAMTLLQNTNMLYRSAMDAMENTFPEKLLKRLETNPSAVLSELFPKNNPTAIKNLRNALVEPISGKPSIEGQIQFARLRTAWAKEALDNSLRNDIPSSSVFETQIRNMKGSISEMFPDAEGKRQLNNLKGIVKLMSKKPSSEASLIIRGGQAAGLKLMWDGGKEGDFLKVATGGALVAGPVFLARLSRSKTGNALLRAGINAPKGSKAIPSLAARMINLTNKELAQERAKVRRAKEKAAALPAQARAREQLRQQFRPIR
jgi:hypothetical protein